MDGGVASFESYRSRKAEKRPSQSEIDMLPVMPMELPDSVQAYEGYFTRADGRIVLLYKNHEGELYSIHVPDNSIEFYE